MLKKREQRLCHCDGIWILIINLCSAVFCRYAAILSGGSYNLNRHIWFFLGKNVPLSPNSDKTYNSVVKYLYLWEEHLNTARLPN